jgi:hypothetical protein
MPKSSLLGLLAEVHLGIEELRAISGDIFASYLTGRASFKIVNTGPCNES